MMAEPLTTLEANLASLASRSLDLASAVRAATDAVRIEESAPYPQALLRTADDRWVRLHSARDPIGEAERWIDAALGTRQAPDLVFVIGSGCGFVLDAIERRIPTARMVVLEPEPALLRALFARRSWTASVDHGRLHVLVGPDFEGASEVARRIATTSGNPLLLVNPVLLRERPDAVRRAREAADRISFSVAANERAKDRFAGPYLRNTLLNLPRVLEEADAAALVNAFTGRPAVVCGAGPSLDRNIPALRACRQHVVLVATDTTVRPLVEADLAPDIVVAVDPGELNARHLGELRPDAATFLVTESAVAPSSLSAFAGRTFVFRVGTNEPWPWLVTHGLPCGVLNAWGSVSTAALDLALVAGCNPIAFAGMDLAYTGGRPYCRGTTWEGDWAIVQKYQGTTLEQIWEADLAAKPLVHRQALDGTRVATTNTLIAFADWLRETTTARSDRRFVNLTGAGILTGPSIVQQAADAFADSLADGPTIDAARVLTRAHEQGRRNRPKRDTLLNALTGHPPPEASPHGSPWPAWVACLGGKAEGVDVWLHLSVSVRHPSPATLDAGLRIVETMVARRDFDRALRTLDWLDGHRRTGRQSYLRAYSLQMSGGDANEALRLYADAAADPACRFWACVHRALIYVDARDAEAAEASLRDAGSGANALADSIAASLVEAIRARIAAMPVESLAARDES
jgi:hypothetical protein